MTGPTESTIAPKAPPPPPLPVEDIAKVWKAWMPEKVRQGLAKAMAAAEPVKCTGRNFSDPSDPYSYAPADAVVASGKSALAGAGLIVLCWGESIEVRTIDRQDYVWLARWYRLLHVESGESCDFPASYWPLPRHKAADKAMATSLTSSLAYFFLRLLQIQRVGANAEEMDAEAPPTRSNNVQETPRPAGPSGVSPLTESDQARRFPAKKQSGSGKRMSQIAKAESSALVNGDKPAEDFESLKSEAESAGVFDGPHVDSGHTLPPTKRDQIQQDPQADHAMPPAFVNARPADSSGPLKKESGSPGIQHNPWRVTTKADQEARAFFDGHYSRQTPGSPHWLRPGFNFVLRIDDDAGKIAALFVWWRPKWESGIEGTERKDGLRVLECTVFRRMGGPIASGLILAAEEALAWPEGRSALHLDSSGPIDCLLTGVSSGATEDRRSKNSLPGECFRRAGWVTFEKAPGSVADTWLMKPCQINGPHDLEDRLRESLEHTAHSLRAADKIQDGQSGASLAIHPLSTSPTLGTSPGVGSFTSVEAAPQALSASSRQESAHDSAGLLPGGPKADAPGGHPPTSDNSALVSSGALAESDPAGAPGGGVDLGPTIGSRWQRDGLTRQITSADSEYVSWLVLMASGSLESGGCKRLEWDRWAHGALQLPTRRQVAVVSAAAESAMSGKEFLAERVAQDKAAKWEHAKKRDARGVYLCVLCKGQIAKGEAHRDGGKAGRAHVGCVRALVVSVPPKAEGSAA